jgi:hypothetical protein
VLLGGAFETNDETCLYVDRRRSKVLVELALQPESRPEARKPPKVRHARTRRGTKANGFRLRGQHFAVRSGVMQSGVFEQRARYSSTHAGGPVPSGADTDRLRGSGATTLFDDHGFELTLEVV